MLFKLNPFPFNLVVYSRHVSIRKAKESCFNEKYLTFISTNLSFSHWYDVLAWWSVMVVGWHYLFSASDFKFNARILTFLTHYIFILKTISFYLDFSSLLFHWCFNILKFLVTWIYRAWSTLCLIASFCIIKPFFFWQASYLKKN